jgi:LysM repeat protein
MHSRSILFLVLTFALNPLAAFSANLDSEYEQVRKIALRDPKVKAAFADANARLENEIVELDPTLKGYMKGQRGSAANDANHSRKPVAKPSSSSEAPAHGNMHVIAAGDTLSSIAVHYKVTVADLKAANPSVAEKKLPVGEKLKIPSTHHVAGKSEPAKASTWDRLKSAF